MAMAGPCSLHCWEMSGSEMPNHILHIQGTFCAFIVPLTFSCPMIRVAGRYGVAFWS